jgi:hypothetical protein
LFQKTMLKKRVREGMKFPTSDKSQFN